MAESEKIARGLGPVGYFKINGQYVDKIEMYDKDGNLVGYDCMSGKQGDIRVTNGVEVGIAQRRDPPKINLITEDDDQDRLGGGAIAGVRHETE